ncbi:MAG: hypothetical protein CME65_08585 [Halobacteriovoraceae bacterium]|nr:hypothetical protein [Halobacteriovoraceae bacterium]|tara:strand:- start:4347 stop:5147 length:801 start_codon:yes stop_codon:yes gene_type:complete
MKKNFSENQLKGFELHKQFKALYDLARYIEVNSLNIEDQAFRKLEKYHEFLRDQSDSQMQKLHKEFSKIKAIDYQFQIYLMLLERFMGQSLKEYQFLMPKNQNDHARIRPQHRYPIACVLDSVRSAHNVGTFFRNSECFGVEKLYLTGLTPAGDHPQVIKTAMQTETKIDWEYQRDIKEVIRSLRDEGYQIISVETSSHATLLKNWQPPKAPLALIFGHEQFGLSLEVLKSSDVTIKIDLWGEKNSLNVGVCQGIILQGIISKSEI